MSEVKKSRAVLTLTFEEGDFIRETRETEDLHALVNEVLAKYENLMGRKVKLAVLELTPIEDKG